MSNYVIENGELKHYGVKGMKWGIRRYQNSDGTLTSEGRRRAKREYKEDNETAFELGRKATIAGYAAGRSTKRTMKIENKLDKQYAKDPYGVKRRTQSLRKKWDASAKTTAELMQYYAETKKMAEKHCNSLVEKYGKEAVKPIKYSNYKLPAKQEYHPKSLEIVKENTISKSDVARAAVNTFVANTILTAAGIPVSYLVTPANGYIKGNNIEYNLYKDNLRERRRNA